MQLLNSYRPEDTMHMLQECAISCVSELGAELAFVLSHGTGSYCAWEGKRICRQKERKKIYDYRTQFRESSFVAQINRKKNPSCKTKKVLIGQWTFGNRACGHAGLARLRTAHGKDSGCCKEPFSRHTNESTAPIRSWWSIMDGKFSDYGIRKVVQKEWFYFGWYDVLVTHRWWERTGEWPLFCFCHRWMWYRLSLAATGVETKIQLRTRQSFLQFTEWNLDSLASEPQQIFILTSLTYAPAISTSTITRLLWNTWQNTILLNLNAQTGSSSVRTKMACIEMFLALCTTALQQHCSLKCAALWSWNSIGARKTTPRSLSCQ